MVYHKVRYWDLSYYINDMMTIEDKATIINYYDDILLVFSDKT